MPLIWPPDLYTDAPGRRLAKPDKLGAKNPRLPEIFGLRPTITNMEVAETESSNFLAQAID